MTKTHNRRTPRAAAALVVALVTALLVPLLGIAPATAATASVQVDDDAVTTVRGTPNLTYYECPAGSKWDHYGTVSWAPEGCWFEIAFTGQTAQLYGRTRSGHGSGKIFVDGTQVGTINYGASTNSTTRLLFTKDGLADAPHVLRLEVVGSGVDHAYAMFTTSSAEDALTWQYNDVKDRAASSYTSGSWAPFADALGTARAMVDGSTGTPAEREAARAELKNVSDALVEVAGLRELVSTYQTRDQTQYTAGTWTPFAQALGAAADVLADDNATKIDVASAKTGLMSAAGTLATTSQGSFAPVKNDAFWRDTDGNLIYSQGGGIFRFGDTYYWYGVHYRGAETYAANPAGRNSDTTFVSIPVYASKDLASWTYEGDVATASTPVHLPASAGVGFSQMTTLADTDWMGRLGVTYNENTGKFVLLIQMNESKFADSAGQGGVMFLQGDSPTAKFGVANIQRQVTNSPTPATGDQTTFTDDDGRDYLVFSNSNGRANAFVSELAPADNLSILPAVQIGRNAAGREGNAMFKLDDSYYMAASDLHGWNASVSHVIKSQTSDIQGAYGPEFDLSGTADDYSHVTQTGFFVTVHGTQQDLVLFAGDRWSDFAGNGVGYNQWMPITKTGDDLQLHSVSDWQINATTGEWKVGDGNNYLLNPNVEADRVAVSNVQGWTYAGTTSAIANQADNAGRVGNFHLAFTSAADFSAAASQDVAVPDGLYTVTAQVRNGITSTTAAASLYATAGGATSSLDLSDLGGSWGQVTLPNVRVTGGQVQVGISTAGVPGGQWLDVDDLTLVVQPANDPSLASLTVAGNPVDLGSDVLTAAVPDGTVLSTDVVQVATTDPRAVAQVSTQDATVVVVVTSPLGSTRTYRVAVQPGAWDSSTVYNTGSLVSSGGAVYSALWWTSGEVPGRSSTGAWQEIASTADGTALWTASRVFEAGEVAAFQGVTYTAQWWTRNQQPGDPNGPWKQVLNPNAPGPWSGSTVYTAGDRVTYDGATYEAQWWTSAQAPGAPWGPWKLVS
ncbi:carbohydrate-binding protein [Cellulomonas sp. McL0617]|uniref:carbohydrate-binding protein n=1 Tax=Cellulomonas sp. McL0617 TaxID=3415675 RepID=UPI003CEF9321